MSTSEPTSRTDRLHGGTAMEYCTQRRAARGEGRGGEVGGRGGEGGGGGRQACPQAALNQAEQASIVHNGSLIITDSNTSMCPSSRDPECPSIFSIHFEQ